MAKHAKTTFKFSCGGFFDGYWKLEIFESNNGYYATYSNSTYSEIADRDPSVSEEQMGRLQAKLNALGVNRWFCHYYSPILDGTQWGLQADGPELGGSNAFPEGFDELAAFLAEEFGCPELYFKGGLERRFPDEMEDIDHLAVYADSLVNLDKAKRRYEEGAIDDDKLEEERKDAEGVARELLHDVYVFVERNPSYKDYRSVLERHNIPPDVHAIAAQDMNEADDELIVASMLAISRLDRLDGHSDDFGACAKNGTFVRWLNRLWDGQSERF